MSMTSFSVTKIGIEVVLLAILEMILVIMLAQIFHRTYFYVEFFGDFSLKLV